MKNVLVLFTQQYDHIALWTRAKGFSAVHTNSFINNKKKKREKATRLHNENEIDKKMKVKNVI